MLYQWHKVDQDYKPKTIVSFDNIKSNEIVYQVGNDEQKVKVDELIERLESEGYVPKKSYKELKEIYPKPVPLFISHVELFARTATLLMLTAVGLNGNSLSGISSEIPLGILPNDIYRCCGYYYNHPGCYFGPVKYETTPWKLVPDNFSKKVWTTKNVEKLWNSKIVKGTFHLKDPSDLIIELKQRLTDKVVEYVKNGTGEPEESLGIEYFLLKEYGTIEWGKRKEVGSEESSEEESPPPSELDTTLPEGPDDEQGPDDEVVVNREALMREQRKTLEENVKLLLRKRDFDTANDNINVPTIVGKALGILKALDNYTNTEINNSYDIISNLMVEPYGNEGIIVSNPNPNNYFKWVPNSCWYDSFITCLFTNPGSKIESDLRKTDIMYTNCDKNEVRNAIMDDIEYIQSPFKSFAREAKGIQYFTQNCVKKPERLASYGDIFDTFINFKTLFALKIDNVKFVAPESDEVVVAFASLRHINDDPNSEGSHFIAHVRKEDGDWIRIDGHADDEKVVLVPNIEDFLKLEGTVIENRFIRPVMFLIVPGMRIRGGDNNNNQRTTPPTTPIRRNDIISTPESYFEEWKEIRDEYDDLVQPIYLSKKTQDKQKTKEEAAKIPSNNNDFYNTNKDLEELDEYDKYYKDVKGNNIKFDTDPRVFEKLKKIRNLFKFNVFNDDLKKQKLNALIRLAMTPKYEARIEKLGEANFKLKKSEYETEFDESQVKKLIGYLLKLSSNNVIQV